MRGEKDAPQLHFQPLSFQVLAPLDSEALRAPLNASEFCYQANPTGITNSETASLLGLRSDYGGGSKDYLSYSVLGLLLREGKLERRPGGRKHVARVR